MPVINSVGQSEYSQMKEDHYSKILAWHMKVASIVIEKDTRNNYLMIDATAGTGKLYDQGCIDGSPLVFLKQAQAHLPYKKWKAVFCEEKAEHFKWLHINIGGAPNTTLQPLPYQEVLRQYDGKYQIGLLYVDPNGTPDFDALCQFAKQNPRMEILISVTANGVKRANLTDYRLNEWVEKIGKRYWAIRKPYGKWQWTFLFGSDYVGFNKEYRSIDLYPTDSQTGKAYMDAASYTKAELNEMSGQQVLADSFFN